MASFSWSNDDEETDEELEELMQTWSYDEDEEEDYEEDEDAEEEAVVDVAKTFTKEEDATEAPPIETKETTEEAQAERPKEDLPILDSKALNDNDTQDKSGTAIVSL